MRAAARRATIAAETEMTLRHALAVAGLALLLTALGGGAPVWRPLPAAPIPGRIVASAVWTGSRMLVWGGTRQGRERSDGAAYDPVTRTWRRLPDAPAGTEGGYGAAAWTPEGMVVFAANSPDGPVGTAVYDLQANRWRSLPAGPLGIRESYASVWTGTELLVVGGNSGDALAKPTGALLDPRTGAWRVPRTLAALPGLMPSGAVWTGTRALVAGLLRNRTPVLLSFDPRTNALRRTALPEAGLALVGWTGSRALFTRSTTPTAPPALLLYDPAAGTWAHAAAAPCAPPASGYSQSVWAGGRFVAACGTNRLQVYRPRTNRWRILAAGPSPLNRLSWGANVWTGTTLISWSGTVKKPFNPMPAVGASIVLGR